MYINTRERERERERERGFLCQRFGTIQFNPGTSFGKTPTSEMFPSIAFPSQVNGVTRRQSGLFILVVTFDLLSIKPSCQAPERY